MQKRYVECSTAKIEDEETSIAVGFQPMCQRGGGADGQLVQFRRGGAVLQAADGLERHAHRVDRVQAFRAAGQDRCLRTWP